MTGPQPDPYAVLGLSSDASPEEIRAAYRRVVRSSHPDGPEPDGDRLAAAIAAYRQLRRGSGVTADGPRPDDGTAIPVRVRRAAPRSPGPDLRAGPVRRHRDR